MVDLVTQFRRIIGGSAESYRLPKARRTGPWAFRGLASAVAAPEARATSGSLLDISGMANRPGRVPSALQTS